MDYKQASNIARLILEMDANDEPIVCSVIVFRKCKSHDRYEVLIEKRGSEPKKNEWALPGGHVKKGETIEEGAKRELLEETGVKVDKLKFLVELPLHTRHAHRDIVFYAVVDHRIEAKAASDAAAIKWVPLAKLPDLAFEDHKLVFAAAVKEFGPESLIVSAIETLEENPNLFEDKTDVVKRNLSKILRKKPRSNTGLLIVFEGIDGAGKSTQVDRLVKWLKKNEYSVETTKWCDSKLLADLISKAKKERKLTPLLFSLLHAADLIARYEQEILPALHKNKIVVMDRYYYTSFVRDELRGVDGALLKLIYKDFREPDVVFHCVLPIRLSYERVLKEKGHFSYYSSGMDLNYAPSRERVL